MKNQINKQVLERAMYGLHDLQDPTHFIDVSKHDI